MESAQLLQQVGLTKYEAEAYTALLREGSLTGYELGKRSSVPLPRSYDVLQRLAERGLALVQPGDPQRYRAADPMLFLDRLRTTMVATLDELAHVLPAPRTDDTREEFWVLQTRPNILAHAASMIGAAERSIRLLTHGARSADVDEVFALAQAQAHRELFLGQGSRAVPEQIAVVVDDREALLGTISPADRSQAIVSASPALVAAVRAYAEAHREGQIIPDALAPAPPEVHRPDWLGWEAEKQRRLLRRGRSVA